MGMVLDKNLDKYGATMRGFFDKYCATVRIFFTRNLDKYGATVRGFFDKYGATCFLTSVALDKGFLDRYDT